MLASMTSEDCKALEQGAEEDGTEGHLRRLSVGGGGDVNASPNSVADMLPTELLEWGWTFTWDLVTDSSEIYSFVT